MGNMAGTVARLVHQPAISPGLYLVGSDAACFELKRRETAPLWHIIPISGVR